MKRWMCVLTALAVAHLQVVPVVARGEAHGVTPSFVDLQHGDQYVTIELTPADDGDGLLVRSFGSSDTAIEGRIDRGAIERMVFMGSWIDGEGARRARFGVPGALGLRVLETSWRGDTVSGISGRLWVPGSPGTTVGFGLNASSLAPDSALMADWGQLADVGSLGRPGSGSPEMNAVGSIILAIMAVMAVCALGTSGHAATCCAVNKCCDASSICGMAGRCRNTCDEPGGEPGGGGDGGDQGDQGNGNNGGDNGDQGGGGDGGSEGDQGDGGSGGDQGGGDGGSGDAGQSGN